MKNIGNKALIIIGMHRSGTSATTGALQCLGVQLGNKLYSGHQHINAKGYFEHSELADINEESLLTLGSAWDDILLKQEGWWHHDGLKTYVDQIQKIIRRDFSRSALWAIKDPRVCRLLPWWLNILAGEKVAPYFLFVVRSPEAVYRSLNRRDGFSREKAYLLWALHYLEAEIQSRAFPRVFMDFDRFLDSPRAEFERVEQGLGIEFPIAPSRASTCLEQFLSKDLRHHQACDDLVADTSIVSLALKLHTILRAATENRVDVRTTLLDELRRDMETIQAGFPSMLIEHQTAMGKERGKSQLTIHRLVRSWSWYTGKPVRFLERWLGRNV